MNRAVIGSGAQKALGFVVAMGIVAIAGLLYTRNLDRVPAYLTLDEAHFAVHAHALADTGRNLNGDVLPLLISLEDPRGESMQLPWGHTHYLPFGIYLIAATLHVLPFDEFTVRLSSALLGGVINVVLIYAVTLGFFRSHVAAAGSAALLALTPANLIISRHGVDSVCQLPFTLGGLCCLAWYVREGDNRFAFGGGTILGLGIYAYVTSVVMMPFFLVMFWLAAWHAGRLTRRAIIMSLTGFAVAVMPMAAWLAWHPDVFDSIRVQYNRADPTTATVMEIAQRGGPAAAIREFIRVYWSYFDPSFLFVTGSSTRTLSTNQAGVFLWPILLLAPLGIYHIRTNRTAQWLFIVCVLAAPIPAVIKGAPFQIQRASGLLVFVSVLAGCGVAALWWSSRIAARLCLLALSVIVAWQFSMFYRDYQGDYRVRSAAAYDPTAFPEAAATILEADRASPINAIYLPAGLYDMSAKWRFQVTKHQRMELLERTRYYETDGHALETAPPGTWAVVPAGEQAYAGWITVKIVQDLAGESTLVVLRRPG